MKDDDYLDPAIVDDEDELVASGHNMDILLTIHRDPDGYIGFMRKGDPEHPQLDRDGNIKTVETLFSIRADELRTMLPGLARWIIYDSYFTLSTYYKPAPFANKMTGLPDVWRKEKHLKSLNTCYVDIDCGRPESEEPGGTLPWRVAQHQAEKLADNGVIPHPSIMVRSGRGVYLLWLLRDEKDPGRGPHAWPEKVVTYKAINRALGDLLRSHELPADPKAIDAARVLRLPDSINRSANRPVRYVAQFDDSSRLYCYTLRELAEKVKLTAPPTELPPAVRELAKQPQYRRTKNPGSVPLRSAGPRKLNALRASDLLTIQAWRGRFIKRGLKYPDGHVSLGRRFMLSLYAEFLRGAGQSKAAVIAALKEMAVNMHPPYPSDPPDQDPPVKTIATTAYRPTWRGWSNAKLCRLLGITDDVARELQLRTIRSKAVALEADRARPTREDIIRHRRALAAQYLKIHRRTTARHLAEFYKGAGVPGGVNTANEDLNAIGYVIGRSKGGRNPKGTE